jgi:ribosomal-protein-alanine N-acetyltransferase
MLQGHPDSLGLVGEEGRGVLGFLLCRHAVDELEILNLAVAPEARRTGAGSQLLEAALRQARAAGIRRVFLEVRESNRAAVAFYSRHGFCPAGRRPGYYTQPVEDALLLQLSL